MARRGHRKPQQVAGNRSRSAGMTMRAEEFIEWQRVRQYSPRTITLRRKCLSYFIEWCGERGLLQPEEISKSILERYQHWVAQKRKPNGQPLEPRTQHMRLVPVKMFFRWLCRQNYILYNPASELEMPRCNQRLPRAVLSAREAEIVLGQPDLTHPLGLRDRAMLETLYSTGIRRMELANLATHDVDRERGTLTIRQGKGKKDRIIPIGERALFWIGRYAEEVRPTLLHNPGEAGLFLTHWGEAMMPDNVTLLMRQYVKAAQIGKQGACHIFRHTMATLMLENGADIRFIQAMLGHADLSSTEVYTHVAVRQLKAVHEQTHPAAHLKSGPDWRTGEEDKDEAMPPDPQQRAALLASLKATGVHVKNS